MACARVAFTTDRFGTPTSDATKCPFCISTTTGKLINNPPMNDRTNRCFRSQLFPQSKSYHKPGAASPLSATASRRPQTPRHSWLIQHPTPNDLVTTFGGQIASSSLMPVFLACLNVEWLGAQLCSFHFGPGDGRL